MFGTDISLVKCGDFLSVNQKSNQDRHINLKWKMYKINWKITNFDRGGQN